MATEVNLLSFVHYSNATSSTFVSQYDNWLHKCPDSSDLSVTRASALSELARTRATRLAVARVRYIEQGGLRGRVR